VVVDAEGEGLLGEFLFSAKMTATSAGAPVPEPVPVSAMPPLTTTKDAETA